MIQEQILRSTLNDIINAIHNLKVEIEESKENIDRDKIERIEARREEMLETLDKAIQ